MPSFTGTYITLIRQRLHSRSIMPVAIFQAWCFYLLQEFCVVWGRWRRLRRHIFMLTAHVIESGPSLYPYFTHYWWCDSCVIFAFLLYAAAATTSKKMVSLPSLKMSMSSHHDIFELASTATPQPAYYHAYYAASLVISACILFWAGRCRQLYII